MSMTDEAGIAKVVEGLVASGVGFLLCVGWLFKKDVECCKWWKGFKQASFAQGLPSQFVTRGALKAGTGLQPITTNIVCCVAAKLGHLPWTLAPGFPFVDCIVGIDVSKGYFEEEEDRAAGVCVITNGGEPLSLQLSHKPCDGETVTEEFLRKAIRDEDIRGKRVVVLRHGPFRGLELDQLSSILAESGAQGTFVEVVERTNVRMFSTGEKHARPDSYLEFSPTEWIVVASKPFMGSARPVRIILGRNDLAIPMPQVAQLFALLRRFCFGSVLPPKLPSPLHYADSFARGRRELGSVADGATPESLAF